MQVLLEAPITFEVPGGVTHAPMVHASVAGAPTRLILDTGSTDHILTAELIAAVGLSAEPGEPGTDSTGASVPSWRVPVVAVEIGGRAFSYRDVVVIAGPEPFERWGIGGFLSPQHLHPTACTVLDLVADRLFLLDGPGTDAAAWIAARHPGLLPLSLDPVAGDGTVLVHGAIAPYRPVVAMLDTGARRTQFAAAAVPGLEVGRQRSAGRGVGGGEQFGNEVLDQSLMVGSASLPVASLIIGREADDRLGLVGMDLLRGTVLMVSADPSRPVSWLVPPARL